MNAHHTMSNHMPLAVLLTSRRISVLVVGLLIALLVPPAAVGADTAGVFADDHGAGGSIPALTPFDDEEACDASGSDMFSPAVPAAFAPCDDWSDWGRPTVSSPSLGLGGLASGPGAPSALCETVQLPGQGCPRWEAHYVGKNDDSEFLPLSGGKAVAASPDGESVVVTGGWYDPNASDPDQRVVTVAYDAATGAERWSATWTPDGGQAYGLTVVVTPDSSLVVVAAQVTIPRDGGPWGCVAQSELFCGSAILAYDAVTGDLRWSALYDPGTGIQTVLDIAGGNPPPPKMLAVSADGRTVFLTVKATAAGMSHFAMATGAFDTATGDQRWTNHYDGPLQAFASPIAVLPDPDGEHVYTAGTTRTPEGRQQVVLKIDAATGTTLEEWRVAAADPDGESDTWDAALAADRLVMTSQSKVGDRSGIGIVTLDTTNGTIKSRTFTEDPAGKALYGVRVFVTPDGTSALVAGGWTGGSRNDYFAASYDTATGDQRWLTRIDGGIDNSSSGLDVIGPELLKGAALSPDGAHLVLAGWSRLNPGLTPDTRRWHAYLTVAVDTEVGQPLWFHRYAATHAGAEVSISEAYGVAIGPDGTAYVTGHFGRQYPEPGATGDRTYAIATVAYPRAPDALP